MTGPTRPTDPNEGTDPTPTEDMMTTPTTSSPPESDTVAQAGSTTPIDGTDLVEAHDHRQPPTETGPLGGAPRPTLGDGPTVAQDSPPQPAPAKGPRMRSIAWGLVLALLGAVVIAVGLGVRLDLELVFIGILAVAGLTLLVGSLVSGTRKR